LDTLLPTPSGWMTMGYVQPGDLLLGADGQPTRVVAKSGVHHRRCYRVNFGDGASVIAANEHLWPAGCQASRYAEKPVSTSELFDLKARPIRQTTVTIENLEPADLPAADLPLICR
jgi:replicative DNA helicase